MERMQLSHSYSTAFKHTRRSCSNRENSLLEPFREIYLSHAKCTGNEYLVGAPPLVHSCCTHPLLPPCTKHSLLLIRALKLEKKGRGRGGGREQKSASETRSIDAGKGGLGRAGGEGRRAVQLGPQQWDCGLGVVFERR